MGDTKISWTNKVWNPVTGCTKVSDGCKNCYAERLFPRVYGNDLVRLDQNIDSGYTNSPPTRKRKFTDVKPHHGRLDQPLRWKKPLMIFVCSMGDLFHESIPDDFILNCLSIMSHTDCLKHTFQILTKRPKRMAEIINGSFELPDNIWLGVSAENQKTADERIPILLQIPAKVRWVSVEPMLESIDLEPYLKDLSEYADESKMPQAIGVNWVVVGAESGAKRRPCDTSWVLSIVEQCKTANIPVFVKQINPFGKLVKDIDKFPKSLQIREYPK